MAVSDLELPTLELHEEAPSQMYLHVKSSYDGFGPVMLGVLRTMADDYGALVLLDLRHRGPGDDIIGISLVETAFAEGRSFTLSAGQD